MMALNRITTETFKVRNIKVNFQTHTHTDKRPTQTPLDQRRRHAFFHDPGLSAWVVLLQQSVLYPNLITQLPPPPPPPVNCTPVETSFVGGRGVNQNIYFGRKLKNTLTTTTATTACRSIARSQIKCNNGLLNAGTYP